MAKYKWDLSELRNNIKIIESLLQDENDPYTIELMKDTIKQYYYMISCVIPDKSENHDEVEDFETIQEFLEDILYEADYYDAKLINLLTDTYPIIKDFKQSDNTQYIIRRTNDELLEETNELLKQTLNKSQYQRYQKDVSENPNHLHIMYSPQKTNGTNIIDPILKKKYVLINRCNEPIDITTMTHEYYHFIFNNFTSHKIFENTLRYSIELEGSFANFLTIEDLKENNPKIANNYLKTFYYIIKS